MIGIIVNIILIFIGVILYIKLIDTEKDRINNIKNILSEMDLDTLIKFKDQINKRLNDSYQKNIFLYLIESEISNRK